MLIDYPKPPYPGQKQPMPGSIKGLETLFHGSSGMREFINERAKFTRSRDRTRGVRLDDRQEDHEAQRSDAKRDDTQNFFHIRSYACSISR